MSGEAASSIACLNEVGTNPVNDRGMHRVFWTVGLGRGGGLGKDVMVKFCQPPLGISCSVKTVQYRTRIRVPFQKQNAVAPLPLYLKGFQASVCRMLIRFPPPVALGRHYSSTGSSVLYSKRYPYSRRRTGTVRTPAYTVTQTHSLFSTGI